MGRCKHKQTDRPPPNEPPETKTGSSPETSSKQGEWQSCMIHYHWLPCHLDVMLLTKNSNIPIIPTTYCFNRTTLKLMNCLWNHGYFPGSNSKLNKAFKNPLMKLLPTTISNWQGLWLFHLRSWMTSEWMFLSHHWVKTGTNSLYMSISYNNHWSQSMVALICSLNPGPGCMFKPDLTSFPKVVPHQSPLLSTEKKYVAFPHCHSPKPIG